VSGGGKRKRSLCGRLILSRRRGGLGVPAAFSTNDPITKGLLEGTRFDENATFEYNFQTPVQDRIELLANLVAGKRVLHIGCCDHHIPAIIQNKIAAKTWLHGRLTEVATHCVGIDIDATAVSNARSISQLTNIFYGDITNKQKIAEIENDVFDYAIFGEVVEHVGNPVHFLESFLSNYKENISQVIITVPNALRAGNIRNVFKTRETINSDHRFFFTPFTIAKLAWDAGLAPVSMQVAHYSDTAGTLKQIILNRFPLLAEDLVYVGAPRS
jgi:hypothetical protein